MNPELLLAKYFTAEALPIILEHSRHVAGKAVELARRSSNHLDIDFIVEAAMLHDIGVSQTDSPGLHCTGQAPYLSHGVLGREILEAEGFPLHALVCERHIGVGLTIEDIISQRLPLPLRDMTPKSPEERIIAFADLFFSKKLNMLSTEKSLKQIREGLALFGATKVAILDEWVKEFAPQKSL